MYVHTNQTMLILIFNKYVALFHLLSIRKRREEDIGSKIKYSSFCLWIMVLEIGFYKNQSIFI